MFIESIRLSMRLLDLISSHFGFSLFVWSHLRCLDSFEVGFVLLRLLTPLLIYLHLYFTHSWLLLSIYLPPCLTATACSSKSFWYFLTLSSRGTRMEYFPPNLVRQSVNWLSGRTVDPHHRDLTLNTLFFPLCLPSLSPLIYLRDPSSCHPPHQDYNLTDR